ncbi:MAG TPA: HK97-gp10 family putative phage morphogenesis protein [Clostridia bacterium]
MGYSARQRKVKVRVEGAKTLAKDLKAMDEAAADALMKGAKAGGAIALRAAQENCPVDTGALKASLKLTEDKKTEKKATVKVDYDKSIKYGAFVELGVRGKQGNPFLRNAVDKNQDKINKTIVSEIAKAVGKKI